MVSQNNWEINAIIIIIHPFLESKLTLDTLYLILKSPIINYLFS